MPQIAVWDKYDDYIHLVLWASDHDNHRNMLKNESKNVHLIIVYNRKTVKMHLLENHELVY